MEERYHSKTVNKQKETPDLFLCGINPVFEALKADMPLNKVFIETGHERSGRLGSLFSLARTQGVPVIFVAREKLNSLSQGRHHQGVVASQATAIYVDPVELIAKAFKTTSSPVFLLLDSVQDPHNLGSLLRSSDALGANGVFIPKRRSVGLSGGVDRASAGAIAHVPVARVGSLSSLANTLKKKGCWLVGADSSGKTDLWNFDISGPVGLILGGEDEGLSKGLLNICDVIVRIPMCGKLNSLNVGVAGALCLYEIWRIRHGGGKIGIK